MALSETFLKKFSKEEFVNLALDYESKFDSTLAEIRNEFSELTKIFENLGSELAVTNMSVECWTKG